jgi:hypothetical protein
MNCDTAFDLMTDSHGSRSGALAQHFETCPRCRRMQETLAPALEFLTQDESWQGHSVPSAGGARAGSVGRQPLAIADSVSIAQLAAARLAAQADPPRARQRRLAAQALRYAAVFAAGLLLAFLLVPDRDAGKTIPSGQCTRNAAAGESRGRSAAAVQALAQSCSICHTALPSSKADKQSALLRSERATPWDWLSPFFHDECRPSNDPRLVAGSIDLGWHVRTDV